MEVRAWSSTLASLFISLRERLLRLSVGGGTASVIARAIMEMQPYTCTSLGREGFHFVGEAACFLLLHQNLPSASPVRSKRDSRKQQWPLCACHSAAHRSVVHLEWSFPQGQLPCGCASGSTCCTAVCRFFLSCVVWKTAGHCLECLNLSLPVNMVSCFS